jgi:uncharacterized protein YjbI with pentapeptide repeats
MTSYLLFHHLFSFWQSDFDKENFDKENFDKVTFDKVTFEKVTFDKESNSNWNLPMKIVAVRNVITEMGIEWPRVL